MGCCMTITMVIHYLLAAHTETTDRLAAHTNTTDT